ncbi:Fc.00g007180.m01.CDS01 [Cosmosporella sp. VM-42]
MITYSILKDGRAFKPYASPYTPEFNSYAFAYPREEPRFGIEENQIPEDLDTVMALGPPAVPNPNYRLGVDAKGDDCGCPGLWKIIRRASPRLYCFRHLREGYGAQTAIWNEYSGSFPTDLSNMEGEPISLSISIINDKTLLPNAAIMNHDHQENNSP